MKIEQLLVVLTLLMGVIVGLTFGRPIGEDKFRNKAIASCLEDNATKPHREAVNYCTDLVDRWGNVPRDPRTMKN